MILIDCFLCSSYPCVLFESLPHMINQESHVYSWNLRKIYLVHFMKFWNLPRFTRVILKFQKSELGKFIPNFPLKHVITSTNRDEIEQDDSCCDKLKVALPNMVIRGGSGTPAISKIEFFVAIALHWKLLTFVAESSILDRC